MSQDPIQLPASLRPLPAEVEEELEHLANAEQFVLYSLNPHISFSERGKQKEGAFHGWPILGQTAVGTEDREPLIKALTLGIRQNTNGRRAACFDPRHGIAAVLPDGSQMDWVICFECLQGHVRHGEALITFTTEGSPAQAFNEVLSNAKIQIAP